MTLPLLYAAFLAIGVALGSLAIWSRASWPRIGAVALLLAFIPMGLGGLASLTGEPRRANLEWWARNAEDIEVLSFDLQENVAIYVYARVPGYDAPQSYRFDWSTPEAERLQDAAEEAKQSGGTLKMRRPFETSLDEMETLFYNDPPEAMPDKVVVDPNPVRVEP